MVAGVYLSCLSRSDTKARAQTSLCCHHTTDMGVGFRAPAGFWISQWPMRWETLSISHELTHILHLSVSVETSFFAEDPGGDLIG